MNNSPVVSVVIPVFNGAMYLSEAIESVLSQACAHLEIIVVDDGSTDDTLAIARSYANITSVAQPHRGLPATLNCGVDRARGAYFAFLDADDVWVEGKLTYQLDAFQNHPDIDMVFGLLEEFLSPEISNSLSKNYRIKQGSIPGYFKGCLLVKRTSFFRVGYFNTDVAVGEFIEWYKRSLEGGLKSVVVPKVLMRRRVHANNMGTREKSRRKDYVRILKKALDRQRNKDLMIEIESRP
jgi:glycosyltransferase involved in cell wall biosynthesis